MYSNNTGIFSVWLVSSGSRVESITPIKISVDVVTKSASKSHGRKVSYPRVSIDHDATRVYLPSKPCSLRPSNMLSIFSAVSEDMLII